MAQEPETQGQEPGTQEADMAVTSALMHATSGGSGPNEFSPTHWDPTQPTPPWISKLHDSILDPDLHLEVGNFLEFNNNRSWVKPMVENIVNLQIGTELGAAHKLVTPAKIPAFATDLYSVAVVLPASKLIDKFGEWMDVDTTVNDESSKRIPVWAQLSVGRGVAEWALNTKLQGQDMRSGEELLMDGWVKSMEQVIREGTKTAQAGAGLEGMDKERPGALRELIWSVIQKRLKEDAEKMNWGQNAGWAAVHHGPELLTFVAGPAALASKAGQRAGGFLARGAAVGGRHMAQRFPKLAEWSKVMPKWIGGTADFTTKGLIGGAVLGSAEYVFPFTSEEKAWIATSDNPEAEEMKLRHSRAIQMTLAWPFYELMGKAGVKATQLIAYGKAGALASGPVSTTKLVMAELVGAGVTTQGLIAISMTSSMINQGSMDQLLDIMESAKNGDENLWEDVKRFSADQFGGLYTPLAMLHVFAGLRGMPHGVFGRRPLDSPRAVEQAQQAMGRELPTKTREMIEQHVKRLIEEAPEPMKELMRMEEARLFVQEARDMRGVLIGENHPARARAAWEGGPLLPVATKTALPAELAEKYPAVSETLAKSILDQAASDAKDGKHAPLFNEKAGVEMKPPEAESIMEQGLRDAVESQRPLIDIINKAAPNLKVKHWMNGDVGQLLKGFWAKLRIRKHLEIQAADTDARMMQEGATDPATVKHINTIIGLEGARDPQLVPIDIPVKTPQGGEASIGLRYPKEGYWEDVAKVPRPPTEGKAEWMAHPDFERMLETSREFEDPFHSLNVMLNDKGVRLELEAELGKITEGRVGFAGRFDNLRRSEEWDASASFASAATSKSVIRAILDRVGGQKIGVQFRGETEPEYITVKELRERYEEEGMDVPLPGISYELSQGELRDVIRSLGDSVWKEVEERSKGVTNPYGVDQQTNQAQILRRVVALMLPHPAQRPVVEYLFKERGQEIIELWDAEDAMSGQTTHIMGGGGYQPSDAQRLDAEVALKKHRITEEAADRVIEELAELAEGLPLKPGDAERIRQEDVGLVEEGAAEKEKPKPGEPAEKKKEPDEAESVTDVTEVEETEAQQAASESSKEREGKTVGERSSESEKIATAVLGGEANPGLVGIGGGQFVRVSEFLDGRGYVDTFMGVIPPERVRLHKDLQKRDDITGKEEQVSEARVNDIVKNFHKIKAEPVTVVQTQPPGEPEGIFLLDGHHRFAAQKRLGFPSIMVVLHANVPWAEAKTLARGVNVTRKNLSYLEVAESIKEMAGSEGSMKKWNEGMYGEIGAMFNLSGADTRSMHHVSQLPSAVKEMANRGDFGSEEQAKRVLEVLSDFQQKNKDIAHAGFMEEIAGEVFRKKFHTSIQKVMELVGLARDVARKEGERATTEAEGESYLFEGYVPSKPVLEILSTIADLRTRSKTARTKHAAFLRQLEKTGKTEEGVESREVLIAEESAEHKHLEGLEAQMNILYDKVLDGQIDIDKAREIAGVEDPLEVERMMRVMLEPAPLSSIDNVPKLEKGDSLRDVIELTEREASADQRLFGPESEAGLVEGAHEGEPGIRGPDEGFVEGDSVSIGDRAGYVRGVERDPETGEITKYHVEIEGEKSLFGGPAIEPVGPGAVKERLMEGEAPPKPQAPPPKKPETLEGKVDELLGSEAGEELGSFIDSMRIRSHEGEPGTSDSGMLKLRESDTILAKGIASRAAVREGEGVVGKTEAQVKDMVDNPELHFKGEQPKYEYANNGMHVTWNGFKARAGVKGKQSDVDAMRDAKARALEAVMKEYHVYAQGALDMGRIEYYSGLGPEHLTELTNAARSIISKLGLHEIAEFKTALRDAFVKKGAPEAYDEARPYLNNIWKALAAKEPGLKLDPGQAERPEERLDSEIDPDHVTRWGSTNQRRMNAEFKDRMALTESLRMDGTITDHPDARLTLHDMMDIRRQMDANAAAEGKTLEWEFPLMLEDPMGESGPLWGMWTKDWAVERAHNPPFSQLVSASSYSEKQLKAMVARRRLVEEGKAVQLGPVIFGGKVHPVGKGDPKPWQLYRDRPIPSEITSAFGRINLTPSQLNNANIMYSALKYGGKDAVIDASGTGAGKLFTGLAVILEVAKDSEIEGKSGTKGKPGYRPGKGKILMSASRKLAIAGWKEGDFIKAGIDRERIGTALDLVYPPGHPKAGELRPADEGPDFIVFNMDRYSLKTPQKKKEKMAEARRAGAVAVREASERGASPEEIAKIEADTAEEVQTIKDYRIDRMVEIHKAIQGGVIRAALIDEVHHAKTMHRSEEGTRAVRMVEMFDMLQENGAKQVYSSATPYETTDQMEFLKHLGLWGASGKKAAQFPSYAKEYSPIIEQWITKTASGEGFAFEYERIPATFQEFMEGPVPGEGPWKQKRGKVSRPGSYVMEIKDGELMAKHALEIREKLAASGQWVSSELSYDGVEVRFVDIKLPPEEKVRHDNIFKAYDGLAEALVETGWAPNKARQMSSAWYTNHAKRFVEQQSANAAIESALQVLSQNGPMGLKNRFLGISQYKSEKKQNNLGIFMKPAKSGKYEGQTGYERVVARGEERGLDGVAMADAIVENLRAMDVAAGVDPPLLKTVDAALRRKGHKGVVITGGSGKAKELQAQQAVKDWEAGTLDYVLGTQGVLGESLSFQDKVGRQVWQFNFSLPWTSNEVVQISGRSHRFGEVTKPKILWAVMPELPVMKRLADKIRARMMHLRANMEGVGLEAANHTGGGRVTGQFLAEGAKTAERERDYYDQEVERQRRIGTGEEMPDAMSPNEFIVDVSTMLDVGKAYRTDAMKKLYNEVQDEINTKGVNAVVGPTDPTGKFPTVEEAKTSIDEAAEVLSDFRVFEAAEEVPEGERQSTPITTEEHMDIGMAVSEIRSAVSSPIGRENPEVREHAAKVLDALLKKSNEAGFFDLKTLVAPLVAAYRGVKWIAGSAEAAINPGVISEEVDAAPILPPKNVISTTANLVLDPATNFGSFIADRVRGSKVDSEHQLRKMEFEWRFSLKDAIKRFGGKMRFIGEAQQILIGALGGERYDPVKGPGENLGRQEEYRQGKRALAPGLDLAKFEDLPTYKDLILTDPKFEPVRDFYLTMRKQMDHIKDQLIATKPEYYEMGLEQEFLRERVSAMTDVLRRGLKGEGAEEVDVGWLTARITVLNKDLDAITAKMEKISGEWGIREYFPHIFEGRDFNRGLFNNIVRRNIPRDVWSAHKQKRAEWDLGWDREDISQSYWTYLQNIIPVIHRQQALNEMSNLIEGKFIRVDAWTLQPKSPMEMPVIYSQGRERSIVNPMRIFKGAEKPGTLVSELPEGEQAVILNRPIADVRYKGNEYKARHAHKMIGGKEVPVLELTNPSKDIENVTLTQEQADKAWITARHGGLKQNMMPTLGEKAPEQTYNRLIQYLDNTFGYERMTPIGRAQELLRAAIFRSVFGLSLPSAGVNYIGGVTMNIVQNGLLQTVEGLSSIRHPFRSKLSREAWKSLTESGITTRIEAELMHKNIKQHARGGMLSPKLLDRTRHAAGVTTDAVVTAVDAAVMWPFVQSERMARSVAYLGAYKAARRLGRSQMQAQGDALKAVGRSQFWYNTSDSTPIMWNPTGRVMVQFNSYGLKHLNQIGLNAVLTQRGLRDALAGEVTRKTDFEAAGRLLRYAAIPWLINGVYQATTKGIANLLGDEDSEGLDINHLFFSRLRDFPTAVGDWWTSTVVNNSPEPPRGTEEHDLWDGYMNQRVPILAPWGMTPGPSVLYNAGMALANYRAGHERALEYNYHQIHRHLLPAQIKRFMQLELPDAAPKEVQDFIDRVQAALKGVKYPFSDRGPLSWTGSVAKYDDEVAWRRKEAPVIVEHPRQGGGPKLIHRHPVSTAMSLIFAGTDPRVGDQFDTDQYFKVLGMDKKDKRLAMKGEYFGVLYDVVRSDSWESDDIVYRMERLLAFAKEHGIHVDGALLRSWEKEWETELMNPDAKMVSRYSADSVQRFDFYMRLAEDDGWDGDQQDFLTLLEDASKETQNTWAEQPGNMARFEALLEKFGGSSEQEQKPQEKETAKTGTDE